MGQSAFQSEPVVIPPTTYPVVRISSEFFLRGIDLLTKVQGDKLIPGLIFMVVWHGHMLQPQDDSVPVREIARRLHLPYETVRRHAMALVRAGQCTSTAGGIAVVPAVVRSRLMVDVLRRIYLNAERMLIDLTRAGLANYQALPAGVGNRGTLPPEQMVVATATTGRLLDGMRLLGDHWNGDVLRALVFTALWTANVKHVTNTAPAASQTVLPDELRKPVSVLAISDSLRLPYETVRRHVAALEKEGICHRVGRQGWIVPGATHRKFASRAVRTHDLLVSLLADLRRAGLKA
jgi:DNA-binding transcriptional regulator YhcF (GntR family)